MCKELLHSLNGTRTESPMTCRRDVSSSDAGFRIPSWLPLSDTDALKAALALEHARAKRGPPEQFYERYTKARLKIEGAAREGRLKAWETALDIAQNGEDVRVVLVSNGECGNEYKFSWGDPVLGVLSGREFKVDARYRNMSPTSGDLILYKQKPYIAVWSNVPSATLSQPARPAGPLYQGYLMIQSIYWSPHSGNGSAGVADTVCQFSYGATTEDKK